MDTGQQNKIQERVQGLLRRINREQLRNRVTKWQKLLLTASSRFSFESFTSAGSGTAGSGTASSDVEEIVENKENNENYNGISSPAETSVTCVVGLPRQNGNNQENDVNIDDEIMDSECGELKLLTTPVESLTPRNKSPVQQWVDSLPTDEPVRRDDDPSSLPETEAHDAEVESFTLGAEAGLVCPRTYPSVQISNACGGSDAGSHCSSMESLLEARKPDPEELLLELGFGGSEEPDVLSRIPSRFLQPSTLKGVAIDDFLKHQKILVHTLQSGFSGYRGLTGPSHAMPSVIVGKIMERLREAEVGRCTEEARPLGSSPKFAKIANNIINKIKTVKEVSVLSPDNRRWYQSQGDKSPEPSSKRIIIGPQSYTFSKDGHLIESPLSVSRKDMRSSNRSCTESAQDNDMGVNDDSIPEMSEELEEENESEEEEDERGGVVTHWDNEGVKVKSIESLVRHGSHNEASKSPQDSQEQLIQEYKNMAMLVSQMSGSETGIDIGTEENFCRLSPEERKCLVVSLIESALSTYHKRLRELDIRSHLKELLNGQLHQVTDLLDEVQSPSLVTLIKQVTSLLRHQESLRKELQMHEAQTSVGFRKKESLS
ncbi:ki-ras-induced actin-interacting protein-IP3R-interacting domain olf186-M isoform X2 [Rhodnius prolixus]|uniref:ki-ras-induced actin-interacting protein-IP3R-interacting domain olf186-M isoform X2 n=1 Tax=Rhodnius prolixus TaxID=13249 RepID=UPI003D18BEEC